MKKIYIALTCLTAMVASSCSDFLDVRPKGEEVENDLFETAKGFEDAIYGVYGSMATQSTYGRDFVWGVPELLNQNLSCMSTAGEALTMYDYKNSYVRERFLSMWSDAYKTIGYANNVLQNLEKKSPDAFPLYDMYKGEMLAARAMVHFDLVRFFASTNKSSRGIPYVTNYSFSVKPISTVGEVYTNLVKDLTEAESLLADDAKLMAYPRENGEYDKFCNYRETHLNLYAVQAILARVHWYFGDNAKAAEYAQKVIDSGKFPLVDVTEVATYIAGVLSPKETIFGVYSPDYLDTSRSLLYNYQSFYSYDPYDDASGSAHMLPWNALYALDIDGTVQDFRVNQFRFPINNVSQVGARRSMKLVDWQTIEGSATAAHSALISGISLINASEMYIIAADALLATDAVKAKKLFNTETTSRGLTALRDNQELTSERIFNEFHKELYGLGQHWFNMKRLNRDIVSNAESRTIDASEEIYVLPIPEEEFEYRP